MVDRDNDDTSHSKESPTQPNTLRHLEDLEGEKRESLENKNQQQPRC